MFLLICLYHKDIKIMSDILITLAKGKQSNFEGRRLLDPHLPIILQSGVGNSSFLLFLNDHVDHVSANASCSHEE